mgnify:CR=1 FL=1
MFSNKEHAIVLLRAKFLSVTLFNFTGDDLTHCAF